MLSSLDKMIVRRLQEELPLAPQPYKVMAEELGITEDELLEKIRDFQNKGVLRRFGAILHHRKAGYTANAMVVWVVPEERAEEVGKLMSSFTQVSHCYQRVTFHDWPFNMFTMVHGPTTDECEEVIAQISKAIQIYKYEILYSTMEVKKVSMKYFLE
ncbi:MAG: transcriptional regulator [Clostridiales bacterium]|nr:transcriptional regulator [Clostridiales bacterium]